MFVFNLLSAAFCSELQFWRESYLKIFNLLRLQDPRTTYDSTEEQKQKKRERERERQNGTPVIAQTWWYFYG